MSLKNINEYENIKISSKLDDVVKNSIKKAQHDKKLKLKKIKIYKYISGIAAAIIIFISSINLSPALAESLNNIPVVSSIVNIFKFHYDKNIQSAVDQNRVQTIMNSKTNKNITITITDIIADNREIFIGYKLNGSKDKNDIKNLLLENILITNKNNETIFDNREFKFPIVPEKLKLSNSQYILGSDKDYKCIISSLGDNSKNYSKNKETYGTINLINIRNSKIPSEINLKILGLTESYKPSYSKNAKENYNKFISKFNRKPKSINGNWSFNLNFNKNLKSQKPEEYNNIDFSIENNPLTLKYVKIYPLHTKVKIKLNTKKCWGIGNAFVCGHCNLPYLIDDKKNKYYISGNSHVPIDSDNCIELYFQSPYFNKPKELYLVINQLNLVNDQSHNIKTKKIKIK